MEILKIFIFLKLTQRASWIIITVCGTGLDKNCVFTSISPGPKISQNVNYTQRRTMEGPKDPSEARRREARECRWGWGLGMDAVAPPQYGGLGALPSEKFWNLTVQICSFFPRFQDILLLHITHSSKVNCTLDKVNCTLCVRKHTILGPEYHLASGTQIFVKVRRSTSMQVFPVDA